MPAGFRRKLAEVTVLFAAGCKHLNSECRNKGTSFSLETKIVLYQYYCAQSLCKQECLQKVSQDLNLTSLLLQAFSYQDVIYTIHLCTAKLKVLLENKTATNQIDSIWPCKK